MAMDLELEGRTALVTGASRGIGRGCALALAAEGVKIAVGARRRELLEELADEIVAAGGERPAIIVTPDLAAPGGGAYRVKDAALEALGRIDILVNSAGRSQNPDYPSPMPYDAPDAAWDQEMQLNYVTIRQLTLSLVPAMIERKYGRIINISGKTEPRELHTASPAKAAVHGWSKGLSRQVAKHGVTVNSIPPGKIISEQILRNYSEQQRQETSKWISSGDFGDPSDIANLVVFLASPLARYITGAVIPVDAGFRRFAY